MTVQVNGEAVPTSGPVTIQELLETLGLPRTDVAVAVDGAVVPRSQWSTAQVHADAKVEVVTAMQGG